MSPKPFLTEAETARATMLQRALDDAGDALDLALRERNVARLRQALRRFDEAASHAAGLRGLVQDAVA